jgi:AcrR family transcriptional regulator
MVTSTGSGVRTGGRSSLVIGAVRGAVQDLVAEFGAERVTIALVAERAGVASTSIYRRWGDLGSLLNEVAASTLDPGRPLPDTGNLWTDLRQWAIELAAHYALPANVAFLRAGAALVGDSPNDCTASRRDEATRLAQRASARYPDIPGPTAEQLINHICAPIAYRATFAPQPLDEAAIEALITELRAIVGA